MTEFICPMCSKPVVIGRPSYPEEECSQIWYHVDNGTDMCDEHFSHYDLEPSDVLEAEKINLLVFEKDDISPYKVEIVEKED
jgi:hypothetical protein